MIRTAQFVIITGYPWLDASFCLLGEDNGEKRSNLLLPTYMDYVSMTVLDDEVMKISGLLLALDQ